VEFEIFLVQPHTLVELSIWHSP